jgi:hypothetical protein
MTHNQALISAFFFIAIGVILIAIMVKDLIQIARENNRLLEEEKDQE